MAKNLVADGYTIDYLNEGPGIIASGSVVVVGSVIGVALADILVGMVGAVAIEKVWTLPKEGASSFAQGDSVKWDPDSKTIVAADTTAENAVHAGLVFRNSAAKSVAVKINV